MDHFSGAELIKIASITENGWLKKLYITGLITYHH